jgi:hypothetical protein
MLFKGHPKRTAQVLTVKTYEAILGLVYRIGAGMKLKLLFTAAQLLLVLPSVTFAQENLLSPDGLEKGRAPDCVELGYSVDPDAQIGGKMDARSFCAIFDPKAAGSAQPFTLNIDFQDVPEDRVKFAAALITDLVCLEFNLAVDSIDWDETSAPTEKGWTVQVTCSQEARLPMQDGS